MILAVEKGHTSVVRELLEYVPNIDLDHKNGYGNTALHESARGEHLEVWKFKIIKYLNEVLFRIFVFATQYNFGKLKYTHLIFIP